MEDEHEEGNFVDVQASIDDQVSAARNVTKTVFETNDSDETDERNRTFLYYFFEK